MGSSVKHQFVLVTLVCGFKFRNETHTIGGFQKGDCVWLIFFCWARKKGETITFFFLRFFIEISLSAARATTNNGRRCRQKERDQAKASLKVSENPGPVAFVKVCLS